MRTDRTIYTDGHDVVITRSTLKVKDTLYTLGGITKHSLSTIRPARIPGLFLGFIGIVLAVSGLFNLILPTIVPDLVIAGYQFGVNSLALWSGLFLTLIGLNVNFMLRKKYGVRISTAMGEKDVVVSTQKEYISQIVHALDQALN